MIDLDQAMEYVSKLNWQTVIAIFAVSWFFTHSLKSSMKEIKQSIDKLDDDIRKMNTRISRIEGTVYGTDIYKKIDSE